MNNLIIILLISVNIWNIYGVEGDICAPPRVTHMAPTIIDLNQLPIVGPIEEDNHGYLLSLFKKMWEGEPEGYVTAINSILPSGRKVTAHQYCGLVLLAEYFRTPSIALTNFSSAKARLIETDDILYDVATALGLSFIDDEVVTIKEADAYYYAATGKRTRMLYSIKEDDGMDDSSDDNHEDDAKRRVLN
mgnify:CR=1 FL=1